MFGKLYFCKTEIDFYLNSKSCPEIVFVQINGLYMNRNIIIISLNEYFYYEPWEKLKEVGKPTLTIFIKKVITSAYSKSSKSAGFNPILQKF